MTSSTRLTWLAAALIGVLALGTQGASASDGQRHLIEPGQHAVFACSWGYAPIVRQHALYVGDQRLKVHKVHRTSDHSVRVHFSHKVTVREDDGVYRMIVNRGHRVVSYRDDCPGGGAAGSD